MESSERGTRQESDSDATATPAAGGDLAVAVSDTNHEGAGHEAKGTSAAAADDDGAVITEPTGHDASKAAGDGADARLEKVGLKTQFSVEADIDHRSATSDEVGEGQSDFKRLASRSLSHFSIRAGITGDVDLSWHDVSVVLPADPKVKRYEPKVILDKVSGMVSARNLCALMGASGAGKTTFLNMLSGRTASVLEVSGMLAINGEIATGEEIRKISAYVQQQDLFFANLTVKEHLTIQAQLRMDNTMALEERMERVDEVMEELGLLKIANTRIGSPAGGRRGISGGEAKRLAFASEVLSDPPLLFADEPTSGLDSFAAISVIQTLEQLANSGRTIICTIHQPPSEVFDIFHRLLLFANGRTAYLGQRTAAVDHFASIGYPCPENYNPADFFINLLAKNPADPEESIQKNRAITDAFHEKQEAEGSLQKPQKSGKISGAIRELSNRRGEPWWVQFRLIFWRSWVSNTREPQLVRVQAGQAVVIALMMGLVFLNVSDKGSSSTIAQNVSGVIFFLVINTTFQSLFPIVQTIPLELPVLIRDYDNRMYKAWIYYLSKSIAGVPLDLMINTIYFLIVYWMIGLQANAGNFFTAFSIILLISMTGQSMGYVFSSIALTSVEVAFALATPGTIPFLIFSGLLINLDSAPVYFKWAEVLSWARWSFEALMVNEFKGRVLDDCSEATTLCYARGEDVLDTYALGKTQSTIDRDIGLLLLLCLAFRILGYVILILRLRYYKR